MYECDHYFAQTKRGRLCIKCGYRPGVRSHRRGRSRGRGRKAVVAAVLVLIAVGATIFVGSMYGQPEQDGRAAAERELEAESEAVADEESSAEGAADVPARKSVLEMMEDAKAEWNLGLPDATRPEPKVGTGGAGSDLVALYDTKGAQDGEADPGRAASDLAALYDYALELANKDRAERGLAPVALSDTRSAQDHSDDMLELGYFSHWDSDGVKPYVTYTKHGGTGYVGENASVSLCSGHCSPIDPFEAIKNHHWNMVYDDAHADWGHRDNILDPAHTHVNFGVSHGGGSLYFVQHFESNPAGWSEAYVEDGKLVMEGTIPAEYGTLQIGIYKDPPPEQLSAYQLDSVEPYSFPFYEWGEMVGMVVEIPSWGAYQECPSGDLFTEDGCVPYSMWHADTWGDGKIRLTADVSRWLGTGGLHTALVFLDGADGSHAAASSITLEYVERRS